MHPPPPSKGSIMVHARSFFTEFKISSDFSKSFNGKDTMCFSSTRPLLSDSENGQFMVLSKSDVYPCHPPSIFAIVFLPENDLANRTAYIVASVPELT